jgi:hypothetical protein
MESRWSGTPCTTSVSQVPQVPCWQDDSTCAPAARTASSTVTSGVTVTAVPLRASRTSNGVSRTGAPCSLATNRSVRSA